MSARDGSHTKSEVRCKVREMSLSDVPKVHQFIIDLASLHTDEDGNQETVSLTLDMFHLLASRGYLKGLVLVNMNEKAGEVSVIGSMLYLPHVRPAQGQSGVYLEHFYIDSIHRGQGHGITMMKALCKRVLATGGKYIKLFYQDEWNLGDVYGKTGFVNHTLQPNGPHLWELASQSKVINLVEEMKEQQELSAGEEMQPRASVLTIVENVSSSSPSLALTKEASCTRTSQSVTEPETTVSKQLPSANLVIVSQTGATLSQQSSPVSPMKVCTFTEQYSMCTWDGLTVNFSDFLGSLDLLTPKLIVDRLSCWLEKMPELVGAEWEVTRGSVENATDAGMPICASDQGIVALEELDNPLARMLTGFRILNTTLDRKYQIAILDEDGMRKLLSRP